MQAHDASDSGAVAQKAEPVAPAHPVRNDVKSTGKRAAHDDGNKTADDDWIEVQSTQHRRSKRTPLTLSAKGTSILRGHPKGGPSSKGNFPIVIKIANHARVWLNKIKSSANEGFYTSQVKSILRVHKNKIKP
jgi:hypothetical protein